MKCPQCGSKSRVTKTQERADSVARWRQCLNTACGLKWKTKEARAREVVRLEWS